MSRELVKGPVGAAIFAGAGMAALVAGHGAVVWQVVRVATVVAVTAVVSLLVRRGGFSAALAAFSFGALTMPVGLGYGIQHFDKVGVSVGSAAGALVFVGGSLLMVVGAVGLLRRQVRRWARLPVGLVLATVAATATWVLAQPVAATNVPRTGVGSVTPTAHGVDYEDVIFPTQDGVILSGWYIPSANGAAVALLHGSGSTRSAVLDHATVFARHGYGVLLFDARGHGRSGGHPMDFGWYGDEDVRGAVTYLSNRRDVDPTRIAAVGLSMGGEVAIGATAADSRLSAVVAEGATGRVAEDREWLVERYGWRGALTQRVDSLMYGITDLLTDADPPIALRHAAATSGTPVLVIAAGSVPTEQHAAGFIRAGAPDTVSVWIVPGSGHTGGLSTRPTEWTSRVIGFLDTALL